MCTHDVYPTGQVSPADAELIKNVLDNVAADGDTIFLHGTFNFGDDSAANGPRSFVTISKSISIVGDTQLVLDEDGTPTGEVMSGTSETLILGGGKKGNGGGVFETPGGGVQFSVTMQGLSFKNWAGDAISFLHDGSSTVRGNRFTEPVFDPEYGFDPFPPGPLDHFQAINIYGFFHSTTNHGVLVDQNYIDMFPQDGIYNRENDLIVDDTFGIAAVAENFSVGGVRYTITNNTVKNATQFQIFTFLNPSGALIKNNTVDTGTNFFGTGSFSSGINVALASLNAQVVGNRITARAGFVGIGFWGDPQARPQEIALSATVAQASL
jgi:hypothetical protein